MKRIGYIYPKICDYENLENALCHATNGKKKRKRVKKVLENKKPCLEQIQSKLLHKTYVPNKYRKKVIFDGISQKQREISIPKFYPDQIVQWAVLLQIKPYIMQGMYELSCASIPNRGVHYGKKYVERWLKTDRKNTKYCLKLDITKFYPSIKNDILKRKLARLFKDKDLLDLLYKIIDTADGLPIGNVLSQWFANFYLQDFDHFIKEQLGVKYYIRYMDDIVIFGSNKRKLHKRFNAISEFLSREGLTVKGNWQVFLTDSRGVDFLGFRFFHNKTILRRRIMLRITRKVKKVYKAHKWNKHNCMSIISYLGRMKRTNSYGLYQKWIKPYIEVKKMKAVVKCKKS